MTLFEEIKLGLNQAIEYEKGNLEANTKLLSIAPVECFSAADIKSIRSNTGMTQFAFAEYLGVSKKAVEAWESGRNHPGGAACRLLALTKNDPLFPTKSGICNFR